MEKLGFPMGGNVDTFLMQGKQKDWGGARAHAARRSPRTIACC